MWVTDWLSDGLTRVGARDGCTPLKILVKASLTQSVLLQPPAVQCGFPMHNYCYKRGEVPSSNISSEKFSKHSYIKLVIDGNGLWTAFRKAHLHEYYLGIWSQKTFRDALGLETQCLHTEPLQSSHSRPLDTPATGTIMSKFEQNQRNTKSYRKKHT